MASENMDYLCKYADFFGKHIACTLYIMYVSLMLPTLSAHVDMNDGILTELQCRPKVKFLSCGSCFVLLFVWIPVAITCAELLFCDYP